MISVAYISSDQITEIWSISVELVLYAWIGELAYYQYIFYIHMSFQTIISPVNKVHGANMGPTWVLSAPDGPHVGPMNIAIRGSSYRWAKYPDWTEEYT